MTNVTATLERDEGRQHVTVTLDRNMGPQHGTATWDRNGSLIGTTNNGPVAVQSMIPKSGRRFSERIMLEETS